MIKYFHEVKTPGPGAYNTMCEQAVLKFNKLSSSLRNKKWKLCSKWNLNSSLLNFFRRIEFHLKLFDIGAYD